MQFRTDVGCSGSSVSSRSTSSREAERLGRLAGDDRQQRVPRAAARRRGRRAGPAGRRGRRRRACARCARRAPAGGRSSTARARSGPASIAAVAAAGRTRRRRAGARASAAATTSTAARARSGASASCSSTQVSLEPPPWLELTIIEPSRSATRVSPPGTMWMFSPKTANGRRSTWRGASAPSGPAVGTVERWTSSCAIQRSGVRLSSSACAASSCSLARGPMKTPLPPDSLVGLTTTSSQAAEDPLALLAVAHQVRRHVLQQRLLVEVVPDHLRDVVVDRLVVGDAGADGVDDRHAARAVGAHQPRDAEHGVRPELERVHEVVVDPPVDRVDALQAAGGADVADRVADHEVGGLDQLDAHLARQEGVLEVGAVERARASRRRRSPPPPRRSARPPPARF